MCLYPRLIKNRKYTSNKKNGGIVPAVSDPRTLYVPIGCGKCLECMKKKSRDWQIRLNEEIRHNNTGKFITLTFNNESIQELCKLKELNSLKGYTLDNKLATIAMRRFLERWRKTFKKSLRHWLVTELGHNGTENIHMHGIVWTNEKYSTIRSIWKYGFIWPTEYTETSTFVNEQTINYTVKYVHKQDEDHPNYTPIILTSPGIGANYTERNDSTKHIYQGINTTELYRTRSGLLLPIPIYYRNKLYSDEEKEKLWLIKLDKNERWVCGDKCKADDTKEYYSLLEYHRKTNKKLGYGDTSKDWELIEYETKRRELMHLKRTTKINEHGYPANWDQ